MVKKKPEHYVNNNDFYELLDRNKTMVKNFFWNDIKDIDFSHNIEKIPFTKQLNKFELCVIKNMVKQGEIVSINKKKLPNNIFEMKPDKQLKAYKDVYDITPSVKRKINKLKEEELVLLREREINLRISKKLTSLLTTTNNDLCRDKEYKKIQNQLGTIFLKLCNNILTKPNFINYTWDRKDDMISDATFYMTSYLLSFDTDKENPFAYFTTVCQNAFKQYINKTKKHTKKFQPLAYIENVHKEDNQYIEDWD